jgi:hypothetical protein
MDDADDRWREIIHVGASIACAQVGMTGFDGPIDLQ